MNNEIFESIIEITRQQDTDSLEYSLAATLAELIDIQEVTLIKIPFSGLLTYLTSELNLKINMLGAKKHYQWNNQTTHIEISPALDTVISNHQIISVEEDEITSYYFPIMINDELHSVLQLKSLEDIFEKTELINGFIRIYQNYQVILTESERDKLTGLLNRKTFENKLNRLIKPNEKSSHLNQNDSCWLVMIDIDHFKSVNDNFGHISGDEILLNLAQMMTDYFVGSNLLFRFGGEEFVIILEAMPIEVATATLEHFRKLISNFNFPFVGVVTISMGFSKFRADDFPPSILDQADKALYYAKQHGRNCLYNYEVLIEQGKLTTPEDTSTVELF